MRRRAHDRIGTVAFIGIEPAQASDADEWPGVDMDVRWISRRMIGVATLMVLLAGCGGDADEAVLEDVGAQAEADARDPGAEDDAATTDGAAGEDATSDGADGEGATSDGADAASDDAGRAMVTVDGQVYPPDPDLDFMGGACEIGGDPEFPGEAFVAYFAASGERVQLSLAHYADVLSDEGEEVFQGELAIGGPDGWSYESGEPWSWLDGDGSNITDSLMMEGQDGNTVEVTFDITCPS